MTLAELLASAAQTDAARPVVTFYDLETGERVELSLTTAANWVAKTANMLQDTLGTDDETTVDVLLPLHWETVVWVLACWVAGCAVSMSPGDRIVVVGPHGLDTVSAENDDADEIIALSLRPLGGRFTTPLPAGVIDYNAEVPSHGDRFTPYYPPGNSSPAVREDGDVLTHADLVAETADRYPAGARVMLVGDRDAVPLLHVVPAVLHASGSLVLVRSVDPEADRDRITAIADTERVTVR
ncbi:TIGR03089 family protein [Mumia zhuanghuii]|uniref:TIGR03089 family protein n=2 Tax=Mumia TaxID=1546255 RepID=A0ABW1QQP7_9ACTN|nr:MULTISPECIES: TIGR03089 family protein [Mumia]KAA1422445.1 TIGR03089 family protein [Mumia zhuanghuii]